MEAHANKAWDGWRDVWHLMKLALQRQRRCMNFIFQQGWRWCVLRPMTTSVSLGHYWIQCCGSHEVRSIKIHSVCRINVLFSCFKFSSWCLVCISNVQLMMLGMHFKIHGLFMCHGNIILQCICGSILQYFTWCGIILQCIYMAFSWCGSILQCI